MTIAKTVKTVKDDKPATTVAQVVKDVDNDKPATIAKTAETEKEGKSQKLLFYHLFWFVIPIRPVVGDVMKNDDYKEPDWINFPGHDENEEVLCETTKSWSS